MRQLLAVFLGKTISHTTRSLKIGGGSAAPGLYALKIDPNLVAKLTSKIPINIIITGTNGKTTTSRLLAHFAHTARLKVIRNHTGSNLERGIASTLIHHSSLITHHSIDIGIWELDEAAFNSVAAKIQPDIVVFLNVFRDQLDRYGEVDSVTKKWAQTLKSLPKNTKILVNGDDTNTVRLKNSFKGNVETFGLKDFKILGESIAKEKTGTHNFEARNIKLKGLSGSSFELEIKNLKLEIKLPLPGIYHIYDAVAAMACVSYLNLPLKKVIASLKNFSPAFGRVEKLDFGYIFLIKNPAGATQVFETIAPQLKKNDRLLLALNDKLADGTDVSWIWDAGFEKLEIRNLKLEIICSGTRAYDLANRLKYAGFEPKNIIIKPDLENALKQARRGLKGRLFILPTYTAMLNLQQILVQSGIKRPYWETN